MARVLPLVCLLTYVAVAFGWRSWFHSRRYGHSGLVLFRSGRWVQHLREALLMLLSVTLTIQALVVAVAPHALAAWSLTPLPVTGLWLAVGGVLIALGLVLTVAAQLAMGVSWRVGVDEAACPGLVTRGLYGYSRNPIYLGLFVSLAGAGFLMPTWVTIIVVAVAVAGIHNQVREEERYLERAYGDGFATYARRVGRFVPGLGTLD